MARLSQEQIRATVQSSREVAYSTNQVPASFPPETQASFEEPQVFTPAAPARLSSGELRGEGAQITFEERAIANAQSELSAARAKLAARQREGKSSPGTEARIAREEANLLARQEALRARYERLGTETFVAAKRAAPKDYFSGADIARTPEYDAVTGKLISVAEQNREIRREQSRSFTQARQLASEKPGIYTYRSGGSFISQAGEGVSVNERGETVTVRSPIATKAGGGYLYAPKPTVPEGKKYVALPLVYNAENRAALRGVASSGEYATAGALFAAAAAPPTYSVGMPAPSRSYNTRRGSEIVNVPLRKLGGYLTGASISYFEAGDAAVGKSKVMDYFGRGVFTLGTRLQREPQYVVAETIATGYGGYKLGQVAGTVQVGVASKYGVGAARNVGRAGTAVAVGSLGYVAVTDNVVAQAPQLVAGGVGFSQGYRAVVPAKSVTFDQRRVSKSVSRAVQDYDAAGTTYRGRVTERLPVRITEYGVTRKATATLSTTITGTPAYNPLQEGFDLSGTTTLKLGPSAGKGYAGRTFTQTLSGASGSSGGSTVTAIQSGDALFFARTTGRQGVVESVTLARRGAGYVVTETGVGSEQGSLVAYRQARLTRGVPGIEPTLLSGRQASYGRMTTTTIGRAAGGADEGLFNQGFSLLSTRGFQLPESRRVSWSFLGSSRAPKRVYSLPVPGPVPESVALSRQSFAAGELWTGGAGELGWQPSVEPMVGPRAVASAPRARALPTYGGLPVPRVSVRSVGVPFLLTGGVAGLGSRSLPGSSSLVPSRVGAIPQVDAIPRTSSVTLDRVDVRGLSRVDTVPQGIPTPGVGTLTFIDSSSISRPTDTPVPRVPNPTVPRPQLPTGGGGLWVPFPGGGFASGTLAVGGGARRKYGQARTVFEVVTGRAGRYLVKNPATGFSGFELSRSTDRRPTRRRRKTLKVRLPMGGERPSIKMFGRKR